MRGGRRRVGGWGEGCWLCLPLFSLVLTSATPIEYVPTAKLFPCKWIVGDPLPCSSYSTEVGRESTVYNEGPGLGNETLVLNGPASLRGNLDCAVYSVPIAAEVHVNPDPSHG